MKNDFARLWLYLKNKKSAISTTLNALFIWALIKGIIHEPEASLVATVLTAWTAIAIGDKVNDLTKKEP